MKSWRRLVWCGIFLGLGAGVGLLAPAARTAEAPSRTVATVGNQKITAAELAERSKPAMDEYRKRSGSSVSGELRRLLRRHALESLIRGHLLILESERQKIPVSEEEAEAVLKKEEIFQDHGAFSPARFEAVKRNSPEAFRGAIAQIKRELAARRLDERVQRDAAVDNQRIHAEVTRDLTRARVSVLALRTDDFASQFPEPREREVLAYYRSHPAEFQRPARAVVSMIEIPASAEHEATARARADSAIAALRRGIPITTLAQLHGVLHSDVRITADDLPAYWRGTPDDVRRVLAMARGGVLDHPVEGADAVLVVRVDSSAPAGLAPLAEVATEIRKKLRIAAGRRSSEKDLKALYESQRDDLVAPAARVRYAVIDTSKIRVGTPAAGDLDRYYRSHMAEYTSYDAEAAAIRVRPFKDVEGEVRTRWRQDEVMKLARDLADGIEKAWNEGKRNRGLERRAEVHEVGPVPPGVSVGTDPASLKVNAILSAPSMDAKVGSTTYGKGLLVYDVYDIDKNHKLTFEEARPYLEKNLQAQRSAEELRGAKAFFERNPGRFEKGRLLMYSRIQFKRPDPITVPLTREEVEQYHLEHIEDYAAPERIRVRHILISPLDNTQEADAAARAKAETVLRRLRAGEDFEELARELSDDPATRSKGGDLGWFGRGEMLEPFEEAAFKLRPGDMSDVVKTEAGYHIIKCIEYEPLHAEPLLYVYSSVGTDAARDKGDRMARALADSVLKTIHTPAEARAAAAKLGLQVLPYQQILHPGQALGAGVDEMANLKPGQLYPRVQFIRGFGASIQWVDSLLPARRPSFENVKDEVLTAYRLEVNRDLFASKQAEIDSLLTAWGSFDSVAALWGGVQKVSVRPGKGLPPVGVADIVDSLVFGDGGPPALEPGELSGWIPLPDGVMRLRVDSVTPPDPADVARKASIRQLRAVQQHLYDYFEELKTRHQVQILDPDLRGVLLPRPEDEDS